MHDLHQVYPSNVTGEENLGFDWLRWIKRLLTVFECTSLNVVWNNGILSGGLLRSPVRLPPGLVFVQVALYQLCELIISSFVLAVFADMTHCDKQPHWGDGLHNPFSKKERMFTLVLSLSESVRASMMLSFILKKSWDTPGARECIVGVCSLIGW